MRSGSDFTRLGPRLKRGIATLCALSLLHGCAARDATRSKGFADSLTTEQALGLALEPQRHAILIGVDHYEDAIFEDLHHAGADASAMAKVLRDDKGGGFDSVQVLSGEATREEVFRALRSVRSELRREDALLVYFSGHGTRVPDGDTWRRFLLTTDSRARNLEETSLDLAQLQGFFSELPAARKVLIVDACFNGDGKSVVRPDVEPASESVGALIDPHYSLSPGEAHLFATSAGRPSRDSD